MSNKALNKLLDEFVSWQWETLFDLLEGRAVVAYIHGEAYSVLRRGGSHYLRHLHSGKQYTVEGDNCSCPDSRFRKHICKHVERIREYVWPT